jgi:hypothetical protein
MTMKASMINMAAKSMYLGGGRSSQGYTGAWYSHSAGVYGTGGGPMTITGVNSAIRNVTANSRKDGRPAEAIL